MRRAVASICSTVASFPSPAARRSVVVGHRVPEEIREAAGDLERRVGAVRSPFDAEEEMRRLEHGLDHHRGPSVEVLVRPASSRNRPE